MTFLPYQYRCPNCRDEVIETTYSCPQCGPEGELIYKRTDLGLFSSLLCRCGHEEPKCIPPSVCPRCNLSGCAWWDTDKSNWASLTQTSQNNQEGVWVTGEFDGDYKALPSSYNNFVKSNHNIFEPRFVRAIIKNIRKIDGPPKDLSDSTKSPITFDCLQIVDVAIPTIKGVELNRVSLLDFRLHEWKLLGSVLDEKGDSKNGRVIGQAYGVLESQDSNTKSLNNTGEIPQLPGENLPRPQIPNNAGAPNFDTAINSAALPPPSKAQAPTQQTQPTQNSKDQFTSCWMCEGIPMLLMFVLIWIMCSFTTGIEFVVFNFAICSFDKVTWNHGWKIVRVWQLSVLALALVLITGLILYFAYLSNESADCHLVSIQSLVAMAGVIVVSLLLPFCWVRAIFLSVLIFLVADWYPNDNAICGGEKPDAISLNPFHRLIKQANDRIFDIFHSNINSKIVTSDIYSENLHRISIEDAVSRPIKLKDCHNRVYIPFEFDKADIDPQTQYNLKKLSVSLRKLNPQKIIVSGYSSFDNGDSTAEGNLRNIQLSMTRASTVSDSLILNSQMPSNIFESRGFGATEFISRGEGAAGINRRVEINLPCEKVMK